MAIYIPPGFFDFIMSLNEEDRENILSASRIMNGNTPPKAQKLNKFPIPKKTPKKKRKVSRYQKVFGKHLKALKKKHPRTDIAVLMKKSHRLTRRELK